MGLGAKKWLKERLRDDDGPLGGCIRHSPMTRKHTAKYKARPAAERKNPESHLLRNMDDLVMVMEVMLHKYKLVTGAQNLVHYGQQWRGMIHNLLKRFPDAHTIILLFDDEASVPRAKAQTQAARAKSADRKQNAPGLTEKHLMALRPFHRLCVSDVAEFDRRVKLLFCAEAANKGRRGGNVPPTPECESKVKLELGAEPKKGGRNTSAMEIYVARHNFTGSMKEDAMMFATRWITAGKYKDLGDRRIIIDRGCWLESFRRDRNTDPFDGGEESGAAVAGSFASFERGDAKPRRTHILIDRWGVREMTGMADQYVRGEADIKLIDYARLVAGERLYVECADTDAIAGMLMAACDWIDPVTGQFPAGARKTHLTVSSDVGYICVEGVRGSASMGRPLLEQQCLEPRLLQCELAHDLDVVFLGLPRDSLQWVSEGVDTEDGVTERP